MAFIIPAGAVDFNGPLAPYPSLTRQTPQQPTEDQAVPFSIDWGNSGGVGVVATAVRVNLGNQNTVKPFYVAQALFVDNVDCAVDVRFAFPDTGFILTVPAGSCGAYPIESIANNFYVVAPGARAGDNTNVTVYNYAVAPFSVEKVGSVQNTSIATVALVTGPVSLIGAGVNGEIIGMDISVSGIKAGAAGSNLAIEIRDGSNVLKAITGVGMSAAGVSGPAVLFSLPNLDIPFTNGLRAQLTLSGDPFDFGALHFNVYFR